MVEEDFFVRAGTSPAKKPLLVHSKTATLMKAIGQLAGKSQATVAKGLTTLLPHLSRTKTVVL